MQNRPKKNSKRAAGIREAAYAAGRALLDLLYPPRCPLCERILSRGERRVCFECRKTLPYLTEPLCKKCGKALRSQEQEYCLDCETQKHEFVQGRAVFLYEKNMRHSIHRMKFQNHREYLDFYAEEMADRGSVWLKHWGIRTILPVPAHRRKRRERGFDQSILLARKLGRLLEIPLQSGALVRSRYTLPQKLLNARERKENLKGAFVLREECRIQEPVLLVDDIYTTGATMDAVCRELKKHGINRIYFLVLCAGKGK